jgi:hypothetical protein
MPSDQLIPGQPVAYYPASSETDVTVSTAVGYAAGILTDFFPTSSTGHINVFSSGSTTGVNKSSVKHASVAIKDSTTGLPTAPFWMLVGDNVMNYHVDAEDPIDPPPPVGGGGGNQPPPGIGRQG